jgi:PAS domain S-box-containing protein
MSPKKTTSDLPVELIYSYLDQLEESISLYSLDGIVTYCNPAHEKMLGYTAEELVGLAYKDLPFLSPEFAKVADRLLVKIKSQGILEAVETQVKRKDNTIIWIETKVTLLSQDNKPFAIQTVTRDITERIETEQSVLRGAQNIKQLFEGITDPLLIHMISDKGPGKILECNKSACEFSGYSKEELLGMNITDFNSTSESGPAKELVKRLMQGKPALFEQNIKCKDGILKPVEVHNQIIDYKGTKAIMAIIRDISQRKAEQEELKMHLMFEQIVSKISSRFLNMPDDQIDMGIEHALQEVSEFIDARRGAMYLITDKGKYLSISHEWSYDPAFSQIETVQNLPVEMFSHSSSTLQKMEDVIINTPDDLPAGASGEKKWFETYGFHAVLLVPIISEDSLVGTMGFSGEPLKHQNWPSQYGNLLRYISTILYNAISRKELYQKLRRTQFTLDNYSDCVYWLTSDIRVIDVNPSASKMLGYSREELLSMHAYDFDPQFPVDKKEWFWDRLKKSGNRTMESVHKKKNGDTIPVEISASHIDFEGSEYAVAFVRDITERKNAEQAILSSREEYKKIFENVVDIFYEASLDGILLNVTPSVERITKYKREELIGKPMVIFYYDPDVREPLLKELSEKGQIRDFQLDVKDIDGSPVPCSLTSRLICDENGQPDRIVGSVTDLRHRKAAETQVRQLSTALEQSPVSVIITDTETRIIYVNNTFTRFSGLSPDKVIGTTPFEITRGQIPVKNYQDLWESVRSGKIWRGELEYTMKDGSMVWLSITVSPIFDENEQVTNFVGILEEINERKIYEQDLKRAKEEAEKSDRLKSAFLANMSHEIRTPMNAILGFSSLLKEEDLEIEQSDYYIDIINSKGKDLMRIISDIIDISRIEAGDLLIRVEPLEIFEFMRDIYDEYKEDTQIKTRPNLQLRLHIPEPEQQVTVNTDPARLKQVFVNLIHNAIKFTPDGYIEIGFDLLPGNNIRLFVRDTGIGIPHEKQKIIFERFRQIDESHTREFGGTGLGLAICKNLVEKMGSELMVKSLEGQGSDFQFTLKYKLHVEPAPELVQVRKERKSDAKIVNLDLKGRKILIVEDDGSSYLFLETLLRKHNPEIFWAKSGRRAIELLKKEDDIDLILMDIRMPEMNGVDSTRKIRKIYPDLPIIAQTAYAQISDRKMALDCGCNDYISKPIEALELNEMLVKYLN